MLNKFIKWIRDPFLFFPLFVHKCIEGRANFLSDKTYLSLMYYVSFRKKINWIEPRTYNEKLQWLKIYDRNPLYKNLVDKYEVKKYVAEIIGDDYVIPTLNIWKHYDDIDFEKLPSQFVLKCTHDSGGLLIVKDKSYLDRQFARNKIEHSLKQNYYWRNREWPYKDVKPRIIAEQYMEDDNGELKDYKFFCFNGKVYSLFIASDRNKPGDVVKFDYFDRDFNRLSMRQKAHPNSNYNIQKPACYEEMVNIAERLSVGIPQVRIDLYNISGKIYFGEYTFFHHGGLVPFIPESYDLEWGNKIVLPNVKH